MRCLSVLDLVILFYLFIFFLGREAQKVREWGVNSLKTSIFPLPTPLRGCRSLLEIVFCRTVWGVCLSWIWSFYFICLFFSLAAKLKRFANGRQFFKNVDFSVTFLLKGVKVAFGDSFCRTVWGVCLSWIWSFHFICLYFSLAAKLKRSANGASIL